MAWFLLAFAGLLEVAWATGLKALALRFNPFLALYTALAMILSLAALYGAMARIPLGIAYPVWTAVGSLGTVAMSALVFGQGLSLQALLGVLLILAGTLLLGLETVQAG